MTAFEVKTDLNPDVVSNESLHGREFKQRRRVELSVLVEHEGLPVGLVVARHPVRTHLEHSVAIAPEDLATGQKGGLKGREYERIK